MFVGVLGVNHKTADLPLREQVAKAVLYLWSEESPFSPYPIITLSTCNRTELYFSAPDLADAHRYLLAQLRKYISSSFEQALYSFFGTDCFFHLCKVAAGLDSAIFAESEIQRQVRLAYAGAKRVPFCMHFMFQKALKVSKEIRSIELQKGPITLYGALWRLADWHGQKILLVGYSQINRGLISFLMHKKVENITLCTRSASQVKIEGLQVGDRRLLDEWQKYGIIVCAANGSEYLIRGKGRSSQILFDLSVPRGIDPAVEARIYNIEEINSWIEENQSAYTSEKGESFIRERVVRLSRLFRQRQMKIPHAPNVLQLSL